MNNLEYERTFTRIARDTIVQIASTYEAPQYWQKRKDIGLKLQEELNKELQKAFAHCVFFQILRVNLPDTFDVSIVNTQVEMQNKRMKQFEQEAIRIMKEIEVLKSETERQIKTINAEAQAEQYKILKEADVHLYMKILLFIFFFQKKQNKIKEQSYKKCY
ncbi:spfh domain band 7 family protein [Ichthyophthirius multifiliis]|uniref:Spfh domain band 7 family protein n=1 Tax=Ichthyophthirius multifiliis TaxID=5932 RepID=G0R0N1_ICHMU|nr:spfh domain band 7 family protein [Ichthyophthirius multifiliis]EGR28975.1 spfh domain band 7 family protein [Ichthyophthirius multifiliis]|eukprot:XP_004030211.1 spfh domain band 7 family protein [Ichthyophthirius multifiliis]